MTAGEIANWLQFRSACHIHDIFAKPAPRMTTLTQALAQCPDFAGPQYAAFMAYMLFVLPEECEFTAGHQDDYDHVRPENVAGDTGGWTKYGVDKSSHPDVDVINLTLQQALHIYYAGDWQASQAASYPPDIAFIVCDIHVNGGPARELLQQGLNKLGAGLLVDGDIGPKSLAALAHYGDAVPHAFLQARDDYYRGLADKRANDRQFLPGWLERDRDLEACLKRNDAIRAHLAIVPPVLAFHSSQTSDDGRTTVTTTVQGVASQELADAYVKSLANTIPRSAA